MTGPWVFLAICVAGLTATSHLIRRRRWLDSAP